VGQARSREGAKAASIGYWLSIGNRVGTTPATADEAAMITVVIPAYNEGARVEVAISSVAAADYPRLAV
jgi:cellulose synthase/poly-beta-1,6-N-acetylglucosamine synthase-like glycosyltransferase